MNCSCFAGPCGKDEGEPLAPVAFPSSLGRKACGVERLVLEAHWAGGIGDAWHSDGGRAEGEASCSLKLTVGIVKGDGHDHGQLLSLSTKRP